MIKYGNMHVLTHYILKKTFWNIRSNFYIRLHQNVWEILKIYWYTLTVTRHSPWKQCHMSYCVCVCVCLFVCFQACAHRWKNIFYSRTDSQTHKLPNGVCYRYGNDLRHAQPIIPCYRGIHTHQKGLWVITQLDILGIFHIHLCRLWFAVSRWHNVLSLASCIIAKRLHFSINMCPTIGCPLTSVAPGICPSTPLQWWSKILRHWQDHGWNF